MKANWSRENIVIADERWPETFLNHKSKNTESQLQYNNIAYGTMI